MSRSWARGESASTGTGAGKKLALGTMVLGTFAGLAFITLPWWSSANLARRVYLEPPFDRIPKNLGPRKHPMKKRIYIEPTSNRINWSRR